MENSKVENIDNLFNPTGFDASSSERLGIEPYSYWKSVGKSFIKRPSAIFALVLLIIIFLFTIFVPIFSNHDITSVNLDLRSLSPSKEHLFGTNREGMDMFTLVWTGARVSLFIAFVVTAINTVNGLIIGGIWGYFQKVDKFMLEVYNFMINIPALLVYMMLMYILGSLGFPALSNLIIAMTITGWGGLAKMIRDQILIFNNREYNIASRTLGTPPKRIITHNLLPYIFSVIMTQVSITIPTVISMEVALAYFGVGLPVNAVSLGRILRAAYNSWLATPYILIWPGLVVALITISFYLIGLTLADAMDPKTHR